MSYVVLARKWRPRLFEELTGQDHVSRTLRNAIEADRVPHALLFTGARGVGKTSTARILAMALNCQKHGTSPSPCGQCEACLDIQNGRSVDVLEIDGASNRGINEIRELRDSVMFAPQRDPYKIYIIDEVHMLTQEAFNALLKTLEEPPPHVMFIFATTEPQKIPVTILSRCQRFDFRRISQQAIIERLRYVAEQEELDIDEEVLPLIARQAQGGMRDALSLLDQLISFSSDRIDSETAAALLGAADRNALFKLSQAIIDADVSSALAVLDRVREFGTDTSWFATELVSHMRDLAVLSAASEQEYASLTSLTDSELEQAQAQLRQTNSQTLHRYFSLSMSEAEDIQRSSFADFRLELAVINLCRSSEVVGIDALIDQLDQQGAARSRPAPSSESRANTDDDDDESERVHSSAVSAKQRHSKSPSASAQNTASELRNKQHDEDNRGTSSSPTRRSGSIPTASQSSSSPGGTHSTAPETQGSSASSPSNSAQPIKSSSNAKTPDSPELASSAPSSARPDEASDFGDMVVEVPVRRSSPEARSLTLEQWRTLSAHASEVTEGLSGLFQGAYRLPPDGQTTRIAISSASYARFDEDTRQAINKLGQKLFGIHPELTLLNIDDVEASIMERSERITDIEAAEERERQVQVHRKLRDHASTKMIVSRWPESHVHIEVYPPQDKELQ